MSLQNLFSCDFNKYHIYNSINSKLQYQLQATIINYIVDYLKKFLSVQ